MVTYTSVEQAIAGGVAQAKKDYAILTGNVNLAVEAGVEMAQASPPIVTYLGSTPSGRPIGGYQPVGGLQQGLGAGGNVYTGGSSGGVYIPPIVETEQKPILTPSTQTTNITPTTPVVTQPTISKSGLPSGGQSTQPMETYFKDNEMYVRAAKTTEEKRFEAISPKGAVEIGALELTRGVLVGTLGLPLAVVGAAEAIQQGRGKEFGASVVQGIIQTPAEIAKSPLYGVGLIGSGLLLGKVMPVGIPLKIPKVVMKFTPGKSVSGEIIGLARSEEVIKPTVKSFGEAFITKEPKMFKGTDIFSKQEFLKPLEKGKTVFEDTSFIIRENAGTKVLFYKGTSGKGQPISDLVDVLKIEKQFGGRLTGLDIGVRKSVAIPVTTKSDIVKPVGDFYKGSGKISVKSLQSLSDSFKTTQIKDIYKDINKRVEAPSKGGNLLFEKPESKVTTQEFSPLKVKDLQISKPSLKVGIEGTSIFKAPIITGVSLGQKSQQLQVTYPGIFKPMTTQNVFSDVKNVFSPLKTDVSIGEKQGIGNVLLPAFKQDIKTEVLSRSILKSDLGLKLTTKTTTPYTMPAMIIPPMFGGGGREGGFGLPRTGKRSYQYTPTVVGMEFLKPIRTPPKDVGVQIAGIRPALQSVRQKNTDFFKKILGSMFTVKPKNKEMEARKKIYNKQFSKNVLGWRM